MAGVASLNAPNGKTHSLVGSEANTSVQTATENPHTSHATAFDWHAAKHPGHERNFTCDFFINSHSVHVVASPSLGLKTRTRISSWPNSPDVGVPRNGCGRAPLSGAGGEGKVATARHALGVGGTGTCEEDDRSAFILKPQDRHSHLGINCNPQAMLCPSFESLSTCCNKLINFHESSLSYPDHRGRIWRTPHPGSTPFVFGIARKSAG